MTPTRCTEKTASLIDHIYFCPGRNYSTTGMITSNITEDITDHFANYLICMNNIPTSIVKVPHT